MKNVHKQNNIVTGEVYAIFAAMGAMGSALKSHMEKHPEKNPLRGIDVEAEYLAIQSKISTLPRHKRDLVTFIHVNRAEIEKQIAESKQKEELDAEQKAALEKAFYDKNAAKEKENEPAID